MTPLLPAFTGAPAVNRVYHTDALTLLRAMPAESVDCVVTSPPYFGLRDYGVAGQIGQERTLDDYIETLVNLFAECRRVLKDTGTFWLNLGDSYANDDKWGGSTGGKHVTALHGNTGVGRQKRDTGFPSKSLMLIPHRVAIALQDDGWICRQDNVWAKPNPMPESVTDRTTRAHEYVFQFAKSGKYYFDKDAIADPVLETSIKRRGRAVSDTHKNINGAPGQTPHSMFQKRENINRRDGNYRNAFNEKYEGIGVPMANKRSVWTIPPAQFREAHFATFPYELPEICIKAGCPPGGLVLDPFMGSGTTALVARDLGRNFIGSELNADYMTIIRNRLAKPYTPDLFIMQALEASLS